MNLRKVNGTFFESLAQGGDIYWIPSLVKGCRSYVSEIDPHGNLSKDTSRLYILICNQENKYERLIFIPVDLFNSLGFAELRALVAQLFITSV